MENTRTGIIYGINGPVIYLKGNPGFKMSEMVYVGEQKLVGEVISLDKERPFRYMKRHPDSARAKLWKQPAPPSPSPWLPEF